MARSGSGRCHFCPCSIGWNSIPRFHLRASKEAGASGLPRAQEEATGLVSLSPVPDTKALPLLVMNTGTLVSSLLLFIHLVMSDFLRPYEL